MTSITYDKPVTITKLDNASEDYEPFLKIHARVNRSGGGSTPTNGGAGVFRRTLDVKARYCSAFKEIAKNPEIFHIVYDGVEYEIEDYDDFLEKHMDVTFTVTAG